MLKHQRRRVHVHSSCYISIISTNLAWLRLRDAWRDTWHCRWRSGASAWRDQAVTVARCRLATWHAAWHSSCPEHCCWVLVTILRFTIQYRIKFIILMEIDTFTLFLVYEQLIEFFPLYEAWYTLAFALSFSGLLLKPCAFMACKIVKQWHLNETSTINENF